MVLSKLQQTISGLFKKYRSAILVVIVGLVLMAIPINKSSSPKNNTISQAERNEKDNLEERLSSILSLVEGAGDVRVILTAAEGEEIIYQTNSEHNSANNNSSSQLDTVTITAADRGESGLIKQVNPQIYLGAVIICSGANDPVVRLSIVDAVSNLTGLGANQISVLKMK